MRVRGEGSARALRPPAAVGVDGAGDLRRAVVEGATENTAVVQARSDNPIGRGHDAGVPRLFIVNGAKALSRAIRPSSIHPNSVSNQRRKEPFLRSASPRLARASRCRSM